MLSFSCRKYALDKQDLSTPPLEEGQKFLPSKKHLKPASKKFLNQGETALTMQTNITKYPNKMTRKGDCAKSTKELRKVALGRPLREVSHQVPCRALITWAGFWKCICLLVPWPTIPSAKTNWDTGMSSKGVWMLQLAPLWAFLEGRWCSSPRLGFTSWDEPLTWTWMLFQAMAQPLESGKCHWDRWEQFKKTGWDGAVGQTPSEEGKAWGHWFGMKLEKKYLLTFTKQQWASCGGEKWVEFNFPAAQICPFGSGLCKT